MTKVHGIPTIYGWSIARVGDMFSWAVWSGEDREGGLVKSHKEALKAVLESEFYPLLASDPRGGASNVA